MTQHPREPFTLLMAVWGNDEPSAVRAALHSATSAQTLPPDHVVLSCDGDLPPALAAIADGVERGEYGPATVLRRSDHRGLAETLQEGLLACPTSLVARADADDLNHADRFEKQIPALLRRNLDILGAGMRELGSGRTRNRPTSQEEIQRYLKDHSPFQHPTVVFRKEAVLAAGGYQSLPFMEDYDLWYRMLRAGARAGNLAEALVDYRVGPELYDRRGGLELFRSDIRMQRRMVADGVTSWPRALRNLCIRGAYRTVPGPLRRLMYRLLVEKIGV